VPAPITRGRNRRRGRYGRPASGGGWRPAGLAVTDLGDVVTETFRVDRSGALTRNQVRADPAGCARAAVAATAAAPRLMVHFDVDAVDSGDLPLANFPHYGIGVPLSAARTVLEVLFAAPRLSAVVLTEVNPSYDADGDSLSRYVDAVAGALGAGLAD